METRNLNGKSYYRILVGSEDTKERANILVSQLEREKYLTGRPFLKLVK